MANKNKRVLFTEDTLLEAFRLRQYGVPMAAVVRSLKLNISDQTFADIVFHYANTLLSNDLIFPPWLDQNGEAMQVQPDDWLFKGRFPMGEWEKRK